MPDEARWQVVVELPDGTALLAKDVENMINIEFGQFVHWRAKAVKTRIGKLLVEDVVTWAMRHQTEHPDHGTNCICADEMARRVRLASTVEGTAGLYGSGNEPAYRAQWRVDHVLRQAMNYRH